MGSTLESLKSGKYIQTNGKTGNFIDRPYNKLSQNGKAHYDSAMKFKNLKLLGTLGNLYSFGDGVWKDWGNYSVTNEVSIENTAVATGGILGGIFGGAAGGALISLKTGNPYAIAIGTFVGGIIGGFAGEEATQKLLNSSYDREPVLHKR